MGLLCCSPFACVNADYDYTCFINPMDKYPDNRVDISNSIGLITFSHVDKFDKENLKSKPETFEILNEPRMIIAININNGENSDTIEGYETHLSVFYIGNIEDDKGKYNGYYRKKLEPARGMILYKCNEL